MLLFVISAFIAHVKIVFNFVVNNWSNLHMGWHGVRVC